MFAALKSLLSVHVAPGGTYVNYAPFSFAWFSSTSADSSAGQSIDLERLENDLKSLEQSLIEEGAVDAYERVVQIRKGLFP